MSEKIMCYTLQGVERVIAQQGLPDDFINTVEQYYWPLAKFLAADTERQRTDYRPVCFIGIQGSQGSGKSTCAEFLKLLFESGFGMSVLVTSIDDFYFTLSERKELAASVHPLLLTRGVPGTHDVEVLNTLFDQALRQAAFKVPVFDKSIDDRVAEDNWQSIEGRVDVVILEGWCVGIPAQTQDQLVLAINDLEATEDPSLVWRRYVNTALENEYRHLFSRLDYLVTLQAPSFDCVFAWRCLQEEKMIERLNKQGLDASLAQTPEQLKRFIAHYQRLTEHALITMPQQADYLLQLDEQHQFKSLQARANQP